VAIVWQQRSIPPRSAPEQRAEVLRLATTPVGASPEGLIYQKPTFGQSAKPWLRMKRRKLAFEWRDHQA